MERRLLISGFDPFAKHPANSSELLVRRLAQSPIAGVCLQTIILPTVFGEAARMLVERADDFRPEYVVAFGMGNGWAVHVERYALNLADSETADNGGCTPREHVLVDDGPIGYLSTLPVRGLVDALLANGIAANASTGAGTFVCNDVFYRMMHAFAHCAHVPRAGFVHVPALRDMQGAGPGAPTLEALETGVRAMLEALA